MSVPTNIANALIASLAVPGRWDVVALERDDPAAPGFVGGVLSVYAAHHDLTVTLLILTDDEEGTTESLRVGKLTFASPSGPLKAALIALVPAFESGALSDIEEALGL